MLLYFFIYNLSVLSVFWLFITFFRSSLVYNFSMINFNLSIFFKSFLIIIFLSLSGLPPFIGFLSKILVIVLLAPIGFVYTYVFIFIIFIFLLYFYIQNLKIILSESYYSGQFIFYKGQLRFRNSSILCLNVFAFFTCFSLFLFDDLILLIEWAVV